MSDLEDDNNALSPFYGCQENKAIELKQCEICKVYVSNEDLDYSCRCKDLPVEDKNLKYYGV